MREFVYYSAKAVTAGNLYSIALQLEELSFAGGLSILQEDFMREFVYYSAKAVTAGNLIKDDLKKAGRLDIVCNFIVSCFFISNAMREDVKLHLIFDGGPETQLLYNWMAHASHGWFGSAGKVQCFALDGSASLGACPFYRRTL